MFTKNQKRVLAVLGHKGREMASSEIVDALEQDHGVFAPSSAYAALTALQRDGLVSSSWNIIEGTQRAWPRRLFKLTDLGRAVARSSEIDA